MWSECGCITKPRFCTRGVVLPPPRHSSFLLSLSSLSGPKIPPPQIGLLAPKRIPFKRNCQIWRFLICLDKKTTTIIINSYIIFFNILALIISAAENKEAKLLFEGQNKSYKSNVILLTQHNNYSSF